MPSNELFVRRGSAFSVTQGFIGRCERVEVSQRHFGDNELKLKKCSVSDTDVFFVFSRPVFKLLICCLIIQLLGCDSQDEAPVSGVGANTAENQQPAVAKSDERQQLKAAQNLLQQGNANGAWDLVNQVLLVTPGNLDALRLAVGIKQQQGELLEAAALARQVAEADPASGAQMLLLAFECHLQSQEFVLAEADLRRAVELSPSSPQVHRVLAQFFNAQGRRIEASEHVRQLIRMKNIQHPEVLSLVDLRGPFPLSSFEVYTRDAPLSLFGLGDLRYRYSTSKSEPTELLNRAKELTDQFPQSAAAMAFRLRMLADLNRIEELRVLLANLPEGIRQYDEFWFAVGTLLSSDDEDRLAIGAFCQALVCNPTDRESLRSMIACSTRIGESDTALSLGKRLAELDKVFRFAKDADSEQARWISQTLQGQVRPWEAAAWLMHAARLDGTLRQLIPELNRREQAILQWEQGANASQVQTARVEKILGFSLGKWPAPEISALAKDRRVEPRPRKKAGFAFKDIAASVGIDTTLVSGFPLDGSPYAIHEVNGGGLAAFDYDLDGRCDVYVVQSGGDPRVPESATANQMYRLLPNQQFQDVTVSSLAGDRKFGQGVCAGDLNQDGFPDLLVANIGANVIYLNQGDGTFKQASELIEDNPFQWTSSLGLADLNGDHLPDLVEINYIDDTDAFDLRCTDNYLDCQPQEFRKSQDRVLLASDEGYLIPSKAFADSSPTAKLGFGLVMADFDRKHGNDFFISNDGDFNHYWQSQLAGATDSDSFRLVESGNLQGCSVGRAGKSQACMGIASGDFDRNGTLDLHVTNFENEPVNLFLQSPEGIFIDEVHRKGLGQTSFGVLGFGTQAADFDNDGWLDLAVLNGHVYDGRVDDIPFRMLPQLFEGSRDGFVLHTDSEAGDYWSGKKLGRTLATLDWNQDGRIDLLANHLDYPIALLQNDSPGEKWIQIELVGTTSERESIGAEIQVVAGEERWTGWQIGGDGLMCSNESMVHFGIGDATKPVDVVVQWPSGLRTELRDLPVNRRYLIVEGEENAFER